MLFNSYEFIFFFLPATLLVYQFIGIQGHSRIAIVWLIGASLFFYGWWNPIYLSLIILSILINYWIGVLLCGVSKSFRKKLLLIIGITVNLGLLGYYKYTNFVVETLAVILGKEFAQTQIVLPLAISFFTFQQIAYLVDAYRGSAKGYSFLHYSLFVTFFPQLIAGPIVHHKEMMPQFTGGAISRIGSKYLASGLSIFVVGLFKKVIIADKIALYARPVFEAAEQGASLTFFEAWGGAFSYTFQLYFDFSGYSDMAVGIACMFGVILPINFFSPYKANNIIEFWRRWHITLSRFLLNCLYIPLGGNRHGELRRYVNILFTMLLGGLWHGAGWSFVIWGGLHGCYLVINHIWHLIKGAIFDENMAKMNITCCILGRFITFAAVVVAWVLFRAKTLGGAMKMYEGMLAMNGDGISASVNRLGLFGDGYGLVIFIALLLLVWFAPNTYQWAQQHMKDIRMAGLEGEIRGMTRIPWRPNQMWAILIAVLATLSFLALGQVSEFLYFNF